MLDSNHSSESGIGSTGGSQNYDPRRSLEEFVLELLEGEFAGVIRSHSRGEVYGG